MSPPPDLLRKKALYAAASVVMAFGLGCNERDDDDEGSTDSGDTTDVGADGSGDDGAGTGGDDGAGTPPDCTQAPDRATCCEELAEWCADAFSADTDEGVECLHGSDFDGSTGCIPWGPPVPPAMS